LNFAGTVWRIVPANAFALHVGYILRARGRWNREGVYGCLYTALTPEGALAEWAKYLRGAGVPPALSSPRDLVSLEVRVDPVLDLTSAAVLRQVGIQPEMLTGDGDDSLELCRAIADLARQRGYHAILSPSAALPTAYNLNLYFNGRADHYSLDVGPDRMQVTAAMLDPFC
jgi:RES domain-containing protein